METTQTTLKKRFNFHLSDKTKALIVDFAVYAFIFLFLYTAINKIWKFKSFVFVMGHMPVVGETFGTFIGYFIPTIEIIISILLIIPKTKRLGLLTALILMISFTLYLIFMFFYAKHLPCNCGGVISRMTWGQHIWFNIAFILLAGIGYKLNRDNHTNKDGNTTKH
jgi:hypothetical protein